MIPARRLRLKRSTGWVAAGQEMAAALSLLSDAAFRLYVFLSLNVDRYSARMVWEARDLANLFDITGRVLLGLSSVDFFVWPEPVADFHGCLPPHADLLPEQLLPCHLTLSSALEQAGRIVGIAGDPSRLPFSIQTEIDI